jgi:prophage regulatory protein
MHTTRRNELPGLNESEASFTPQSTLEADVDPHGSSKDQSRPLVKKLLKIESVLERIPISRSQLYNLIATGKFPKQVHLCGGQGAFWVESEVDEWIQAQIDADRKAA